MNGTKRFPLTTIKLVFHLESFNIFLIFLFSTFVVF